MTRFEAFMYKIYIEYASFNLTQEAAVVAGGVLFDSLAFCVLFCFAFLIKQTCGCFPRRYYMIICYFGIYTILDPFLVLLIDIADYGNFLKSDWGKFYKWYLDKEGNGIVGIYLTFVLYVTLTVINGGQFYFYMIYIH